MRHTVPPLAVLGAGAWGTALAIHVAGSGRTVRLWGRDPQAAVAMGQDRENRRRLPGTPFPPSLTVTADLDEALEGASVVLLAVPSAAFRSLLTLLVPRIDPAAARPGCPSRLAWATKGLEPSSGKFMHEIVFDLFDDRIPHVLISGPSFAAEVAKGLPTAVTVASRLPEHALEAAGWLHHGALRAYTSEDVLGVELGGALKNVLAIAAGTSDGLGFGANARAALITRGLAEMMRLGEALGARRETLMGLSGLGDLVLTCTDDQSRNRRFGLALAKGLSPEAARTEVGATVEGAETARVAVEKAVSVGVEMPICREVYRVLHEGRAPREAVAELLGRDRKAEC